MVKSDAVTRKGNPGPMIESASQMRKIIRDRASGWRRFFFGCREKAYRWLLHAGEGFFNAIRLHFVNTRERV